MAVFEPENEWPWALWGLLGAICGMIVLGPFAWLIVTSVWTVTHHHFGEGFFLWMVVSTVAVAAIGWRTGVRIGHRRNFGS